jgi:hypothetical protein
MSVPTTTLTPVELRVCRDTVEIWISDRMVGITDRDQLAAWLYQPSLDLDMDGIVWSLDFDRRISLVLPHNCGWTLPPNVEAQLRAIL